MTQCKQPMNDEIPEYRRYQNAPSKQSEHEHYVKGFELGHGLGHKEGFAEGKIEGLREALRIMNAPA